MSAAVIAAPLALWDQRDLTWIDQLIEKHERTLVFLPGADRPRSSHQHPLTVVERADLLAHAFPEALASGRLAYAPMPDEPYWPEARLAAANQAIASTLGSGAEPIFVARNKLEGDSVKRLLPGFSVTLETAAKRGTAKASLYSDLDLPPAASGWFDQWKRTQAFSQMAEEDAFCVKFRNGWKGSPYPPTFNAGDAIVLCGDEILLIERANHPSKGLLALPGGFLEPWETLLEAAVREAAEEARTNWRTLLRGLIGSDTFDYPLRDPRGRFISQVYVFMLRKKPVGLKAGSDAKAIRWERWKDLTPQDMAFEHWHGVRKVLSTLAIG